ncbi:MAG TPA: FHA domain-containing protein [Thermoanaerobaculaceae bacterium]|nr:FHA domain-containing protein [Thermoanaerobaculaceae bacterium]
MSESKGVWVAESARNFRLGEWLVEPPSNRIRRGEIERHLRPKLMDLLVLLGKRAGEVVPKEEILEGLWAKKFMAESALNGLVAELRTALDDDARVPRFIETVPKRGYRVIAPVEPAAGASPDDASVACVLFVAGRRIPLGEGVHVVGRASDAAVHVDYEGGSRHHCRIVVSAGGATIEDIGSKNGTFVGQDRITAPRTLHHGDQVRVGGVVILFRLPASTRSTLTFENGR